MRTLAHTVAIVQARMGSTRLPGKVLREIEGRPMLDHVVARARAAARVDEVCVATSALPADDPVAERCAVLGVRCVRGSERDVLSRFLAAAAETSADLVVRITADCPLLDPALVDALVDARAANNWDYASNGAEPRSFPRGLDCEVMTRAALEAAGEAAADPAEREHVTLFLYRHPERFRLGAIEAEEGIAAGHHRWTVDTDEDLALVRAIAARLPPGSTAWRDALAVVERDPSIAALNAHVAQKPVTTVQAE